MSERPKYADPIGQIMGLQDDNAALLAALLGLAEALEDALDELSIHHNTAIPASAKPALEAARPWLEVSKK